MSWYEDSVQVTVQDAGEASALEQAVEVAVLGLDGLREHALGDRIQHTVHDVDNDVLVRGIAHQDVGTSDGDCPSVVVDLDENVVTARRGDLEVAAKTAARDRVTHDVVQHKLPQKSAVRVQNFDNAGWQCRKCQVVWCDDGERCKGRQDILDLRFAQVLAEDSGITLLKELVESAKWSCRPCLTDQGIAGFAVRLAAAEQQQ